MKSTDIIQPTVITQPVAVNGSRNSIPESPAGSNYASIEEGFPDITMISPTNGGLPPFGQDFNGLFYLSTDQKVYLQNGGVITYNENVANSIGGYPKGAILDYQAANGAISKVQSLIDDNSNNFVENPSLIDGENWQMLSYGGALSRSMISNCIISAPQRINLTLGAQETTTNLTLKAGSQVIIPYGTSAPELSIGDNFTFNDTVFGTVVDISWDETNLFYIVELPHDISIIAFSVVSSRLLFVDYIIGEGDTAARLDSITCNNTDVFAGADEPDSPLKYSVWYDSTNNIMKRYSAEGEWTDLTTGIVSLPIGLATASAANIIKSIDSIFNGMGFVGNYAFVDKDVICLMPNGRNEDGSLNNTEYTTGNVLIADVDTTASKNANRFITITNGALSSVQKINYYEGISTPTGLTTVSGKGAFYNTQENKIYEAASTTGMPEWTEYSSAFIGTVGIDNTQSGLFTTGAPKLPFQAADRNDLDGNWCIPAGGGYYVQIAASVSIAVGSSVTYDISDYLPKDGQIYEVLFGASATPAATLGAIANLRISTDWYTHSPYLPFAYSRCVNTTYNTSNEASIVVPVGPGRSVSLTQVTGTSGTATLDFLRMYAYRKVR